MIIVEGPDGAGKSTLVKHLASTFGLQVGKRSTEDRDKLYEAVRYDTYTALGTSVIGAGPIRVWDRFFFSELIYSVSTGRTCRFGQADTSFIGHVMEALRCPIFLCLPPIEAVLHNMAAEKHQMPGVRENIQDIWYRYSMMLTNMLEYQPKLLIRRYDYTGETPDAIPISEVEDMCSFYIRQTKARML